MPKTQHVSIPRDRLPALVVLCAATLMTVLDETVVSVALPSIQRDLGFATANLSWVVNAYLVAFGGLLLFAGRVGDLIGRKRVLVAGLALFVAASVICGVAPAAGWLVAGRFLQGVGGALAASVALGMVVSLFDDPAQQARAIGIYAFVSSVGAASGLFLGGVITDIASWRWVFFINVPIGLITVLFGRRLLVGERGPGLGAGADASGAALLVSGLMLGIVAVVDERVRLLGIAAVVLLALFALRQVKAATPLIPIRVLRSRVVVGANVTFALLVGAMFGFQFMVTLYFQRVLGYSPAQAGLGVFPVAGGIGFISMVVFPRLAARFGPRLLLVPGLVALTAGMALLTQAPVDGQYLTDVFPSIVLFGVGGGLTLPAVMTIAMSNVAPDTAGATSGLINTSQQVGGAVGLAVIAALAASHSAAATADGAATPAALVSGFHLGWTVGSGLLLAALLVAAWTLVWQRGAGGGADGAAVTADAASSADVAA
jgi:EmrB/QacA subfamily drug resistance transporter